MVSSLTRRVDIESRTEATCTYFPPRDEGGGPRALAPALDLRAPAGAEGLVLPQQLDLQRPEEHVDGDPDHERGLQPAVTHCATVHRQQVRPGQLLYLEHVLGLPSVGEVLRLVRDEAAVSRPSHAGRGFTGS